MYSQLFDKVVGDQEVRGTIQHDHKQGIDVDREHTHVVDLATIIAMNTLVSTEAKGDNIE